MVNITVYKSKLYIVCLHLVDVEDPCLVCLGAGQPLDLFDGVTEHLRPVLAVGDDLARDDLHRHADTQAGHLPASLWISLTPQQILPGRAAPRRH